ncbi:restriction endonuclease subunit S [Enterobacter kobei]|uniref:restriction endonuclease subunit S n=1 Tax=Enterobacter kobei TaxID=208224 RepID=UPI0037C0291F
MIAEKLITDHVDIWSSALQTRSSPGRGSNGKIDLYGIKKLRELILELAVRGKLVPQDPNDEPASELLKRIAAEKAELVKQGKIKKQKPLPEISEDEKPFELPKGWEWVRLIDIMADIHYGYTASADETKEVKLLRITDIQDDKVNWETVPGCDISEKMVEQYKLNNNDIVIARTGGTVGKSYLVENMNAPSVFASYLIRLKYLGPMQAGFTKVFLGSQLYWKQLYDGTSGTGQPNVNGNTLKAIILPIAPINEQHKVISKVVELMSLCDQLEQQSLSSLDAHQQLVETLLATLTDSQNAEELAENWARISQHFDTLFTTEASIDALKQTILQLAVMGKLVPQDPNDEPASELLKRIEQEKARLVKEGKIKKQKPLPPVNDEEKPFELPKGWEWCRIGEIIANMDAGWSPACSPESSPNENVWGVLKTTAVQSLDYRQQENKTLPSSKLPRPQYEVQDGDILVTRAGPKNRVGISCLVEKTRPRLMISDKIIRFHLISNDISAKYISLCLNCGVTADYLEASKSGMAESQMNISQENLRSAPVALPPAAIQWKVISTIEDFFKVCDQLKSRLQSARQTQLYLADALTDAALN